MRSSKKALKSPLPGRLSAGVVSRFFSTPLKCLFVLAVVFVPARALAEDLPPMRLGLAEGSVQVMSKDTSEVWEAAEINTPIGAGDRIWISENGRAEIQVRGGVYVRAGADSSLDILRAPADSVQFYTGGGHIYANNRKGGISVVQVDTPLTSVRGYDNSVFLLDVDGGETVLQVLKGGVYAENRLGSTRVEPGETLTIREDGSSEISPMGEPDEWDRWNIERDKTVSAWSESSRYLPAGLDEYSTDFNNHGRWGYDNDYGYVWFPVVAMDWAPYRVGRWGWIGGRYVWISFEPWGWAPYHYGRWFFRSGRGWCWVPPAPNDLFWGPGYVGWVRTGPFLGWVPLAPGEIYYGYGYYGPNSVNIINIDINTIVMKKFRNAAFPHGTTFMHRDGFGGRDGRFAEPGENPFAGHKFDFRPPRREPGVIMRPPAPFGQRPPERVINTRPEKLREERRLVRERGQSVFTEQPRPLSPRRVKEPKVIKRGNQRKGREEKRDERREERRQ